MHCRSELGFPEVQSSYGILPSFILYTNLSAKLFCCGKLSVRKNASFRLWNDFKYLPFQVSVGGLEHALTPLAAANNCIHIFDTPTHFMGALWLPYRRDHAELESAIKAVGPIKAVFAHADVVQAARTQTPYAWLS